MSDSWQPDALQGALERQNAALRRAIAVVDHLTGIALGGAHLDEVSDELADTLGWSVLVFDRGGELIGAARPTTRPDDRGGAAGRFPSSLPDLSTVLEAVRDSRLPLRVPTFAGGPDAVERIAAPIAVGDAVLGFLVVEVDALSEEEDLDLVTVQHAASIYALALVQAERDSELRSRYRQELIEGLLLGRASSGQSEELARLAGLDPAADHVVIVIEVPGHDRELADQRGEETLVTIGQMLERLDGDLVAVVRAGGVTVIAPGGSESAPGELIARAMGARLPSIAYVAGSSRPADGSGGLAGAEAEARRGLAVAHRLDLVRQVTSHAQLGVHRLLLHVPPDEMEAFVRDTLGPLANPTSGSAVTLLETLAVYLRENANLRRSADALFVHVNTVTYRIRRIESLTGLSLGDGGERLVAQLAIEIIRTRPDGAGSSTEA